MENKNQDTAGLCFETAGRHLLKTNHGGELVHGSCTLPNGKVINNHAWVDEGKLQGVYEPEHGVHMPHHEFQGNFNPTEFKRYDKNSMLKNMTKHNHWGPWHDEPENIEKKASTLAPEKYKNGHDPKWVAQKPGAPTARFTKLIAVPVKYLSTLPGLRGEHEVLHPDMEKVKCFIPLVRDLKWQREHPIILNVLHNGAVVCEDGNHRRLAASESHLKTYLCKVTFFGGSEDEVNFEKVISKFASSDIQLLIKLARTVIAEDGDLTPLTNLIAEQSIGGNADNFGQEGDQSYDNMAERGGNPAGDNNPDIGQGRRTGPRNDYPGKANDMMQEAQPLSVNSSEKSERKKEASSNKPCDTCGNPTDRCVCIGEKPKAPLKNSIGPINPIQPKNPQVPNKMADLNITDALIQIASMKRYASHVEETEIPFKDLNLENGIDYRMSGREQEVSMLIQRYVKLNIYPKQSFTLIEINQDDSNKFYVKCLVFDNQLAHQANDATKNENLHKVSNVEQNNNLSKTAWKKRLTYKVDEDDDTGLVACPLESHRMVRMCSVCPLCKNSETYIKDGYSICSFDDMNLSELPPPKGAK